MENHGSILLSLCLPDHVGDTPDVDALLGSVAQLLEQARLDLRRTALSTALQEYWMATSSCLIWYDTAAPKKKDFTTHTILSINRLNS